MEPFVYLKDVVTLQVKPDLCTGCGICLDVCPHEVLAVEDRHVRIVNRDGCMECGACSRNCPAGAIAVDAGVGCAAAVINGMLNRQGGGCCCTIDTKNPSDVKAGGICCG